MIRKSPLTTKNHAGGSPSHTAAPKTAEVDIQEEFNRIEEIIIDSFHIPLTRMALVNEERLLSQIDYVRLSLPEAFDKALAIIKEQQTIVGDAEAYAHSIVQSAQKRAAEILDEMSIVRQAEQDAARIRQQVQQECQALQQQTAAEIEEMQRKAQLEFDRIRRQALSERQEIERGSDEYADAMLERLEGQLGEMQSIIYSGRQQLRASPQGPSQQARNQPTTPPPQSQNGGKVMQNGYNHN